MSKRKQHFDATFATAFQREVAEAVQKIAEWYGVNVEINGELKDELTIVMEVKFLASAKRFGTSEVYEIEED